MPSSIASDVARPVLCAADADERQWRGGHVGPRARRSWTRSRRARHLFGPRAASGHRTTGDSVVRFYTTVLPVRERALGCQHGSTSTKERDFHLSCWRADTIAVRRGLAGSKVDRTWFLIGGVVSRGGPDAPLRETAPPAAARRSVAENHGGAVFCQVGAAAPARPLASAWCGCLTTSGGSRRCQD